jgi:hypothetical protein
MKQHFAHDPTLQPSLLAIDSAVAAHSMLAVSRSSPPLPRLGGRYLRLHQFRISIVGGSAPVATGPFRRAVAAAGAAPAPSAPRPLGRDGQFPERGLIEPLDHGRPEAFARSPISKDSQRGPSPAHAPARRAGRGVGGGSRAFSVPSPAWR